MNEYIAALVDELHQLGVQHVVFSPGSRSTTMAMLFKEHRGFETYMNIDERSAAFMALGIAKAHKKPAVLVCTSGSAVAHYLPAVLEAQYSGVPLIILSADRPHTLQHVGAPQTVDQQKLFGTAVNYYEELSVPREDHYYTYPRQVVRKAFMKAMDLKRGPVHVNVPLFEPLVPDFNRKHFESGRMAQPFTLVTGMLKPRSVQSVYEALLNKKVLVLAGPAWGLDEEMAILELAHMLKAPILADPLSNMRRIDDEHIITSYDAFLADESRRNALQPDCILQIGQMVVSKRVQQWIGTMNETPIISVSPTMDYTNPMGNTTMHIQSTAQGLLDCLERYALELDSAGAMKLSDSKVNASAAGTMNLSSGAVNVSDRAEKISDICNQTFDRHIVDYLDAWIDMESYSRKQLDAVAEESNLFEGRTIHMLQQFMPENGQIMSANSMSIRDMDYFWSGGRSGADVYGNRGTNGIDGTVSTALGLSTNGKMTVLLIGDLSFFHDLNGLAIAKTHELNLTIVLHNNDGGGIFQYLPQKGTEHFDYLFNTPQGIAYSGLATLYGVDYVRVRNNADLEAAFARYIGQSGVHIIEIPTSKEGSRELHKKYRIN